MATTTLPNDFREFLQLLGANRVEYLLIGGYAVGYYGYVRATADMDIWVARNPTNAARVLTALRAFGLDTPELTEALFLNEDSIVRVGVPPFRLELLTSISGVSFEQCYANRATATIDEIDVCVISLADLKANKQASGRGKDLVDLDHLP